MLKRLTLCGLLISSTVLSPFVYAQDVSVVDGQVETPIVQPIVSEEAPNITQVVNEPIVTQVEEPVATADVPFESENGEISEISLEPMIVDGQVETTIVQPIVSEEAPNTTQVVNEPIGTLKRLGVSDPSKPVGKLTRLMQILPETGSLNGDTGIITGVVMLMSAIILSLYGFAKRIFN